MYMNPTPAYGGSNFIRRMEVRFLERIINTRFQLSMKIHSHELDHIGEMTE